MRAISALALVVLFTPAVVFAGPPEDVAAAVKAWAAAYDTRDPQKITALYDLDALFWGTGARTLAATPASVFDYFKDARARPDARVVINDHQVRVFGDIAISSGIYTFSGVRDGQPTTAPARFSMTFRLRDGRWMIVSHHSSRMPAAAAQ